MIKNQWYAVLSSHEVKSGEVISARRFGEDVVFFRNADGSLGCVTDICAHRGASLSAGCLTNGNICCPFHGIEYAADGRCVHIPSEGRVSEADFSRFDLKHYETREIGGIIFAWYGDDPAKGEPLVFDVLNDPSFAYDHINDTWNIHYSRVIENQLDASHLAFVHHSTIGRGNRTPANGPRVVWENDNTLKTSANNEVDEGQMPKPADECVIKPTNLTLIFPNIWLNHVTDKIMILAYFIPVDDGQTVIALRFYNRITGVRVIDCVIARVGSVANKIIERQDKRIVETQKPKASGLQIGENLVAADLPIMEYRRRRFELQTRCTDSKSGETRSGGNVKMSGNPMYNLTYGLFVLTAKRGVKDNGCITNTAIKVTGEPNQIAVAVNKTNFTHDMVLETGIFNISVISESAGFELLRGLVFSRDAMLTSFQATRTLGARRTAWFI